MTTIKKFNSYSEIEGKYSIPSVQRDLDLRRIPEIREHIKQRYQQGKEVIFGAIDIVDYNSTLFIVDGQHRIKALQLEYNETKIDIPFICVTYQISSKEELQLIFKTRNLNQPLPDFLLDFENDFKRELKKEIHKYIKTRKGFDEKKINRPDINIKIYMDTLTESKVMDLLTDIGDFHKMFEFINDENKILITDNKYKKKFNISDKMISKWKEYENYHGIDSNYPWFTNDANLELIDAYLRNRKSTIENINGINDIKENERKTFNGSERQQIWHLHIGAEKGKIKCPYCKINDIEPLNYVIGHVKSLYNDGSNEIENLRPICTKCNNCMGSKNMDLNKYTFEGI